MKRISKKGLVWLLVVVMLAGVISVSAATGLLSTLTSRTTTVNDTETLAVVRDINLKTQSGKIAGITEPVKPVDRQSEWDGSKIYFGAYNGSSILFRVLDAVTSDYATNGTKSMFLDSEAVLVRKQFHETAGTNAWENSGIRTWLNSNEESGFLYGFSTLEQGAVMESTRAEDANLGAGIEDLEWTPLAGDKVFALDAKEVTNPEYGFSDTDFSAVNRVKKIGTVPTYWWLRSNSQSNAGSVYADGNVFYANTDAQFVGVSPAMNVDLSKVLFASTVWNYGASCVDKTVSVAEVGADHVEDNTWKLTLLDDTKNVFITTGEKVTRDGDTVTVPYTYSGSDVTQLSVMVASDYYTSEHAEVLYYGKLTVDNTEFASGSGTGTFTLSEKIEESYPNYKMYLLAEDVSGGSMTDYASAPTQLVCETGVLGDANGDEIVDVRDVVRVKRYLSDTTESISFTDADINSDGYVDDKDLVLVREMLVGKAAFTDAYNTVGKPTYNGTQELSIGAYCGPSRKSEGVDYRTDEQFAQYANAGFNFVISERDAVYRVNYDASGNQLEYTDFATSDLKNYMDLASKYGVDVIVASYTLSDALESGEATLSETQKQALATILQDLKTMSNFKGLFMADEPRYAEVPSYDAVTKYLKTQSQMDGKLMYVSLLPYNCKKADFEGFIGDTKEEMYKEYLKTYSSMLGLTNYDFYPFRENTDNTYYMHADWFKNLELAAANAYGTTDSGITIQAMRMTNAEGTPVYRKVDKKEDFTYQLYSAMAYGMKNVSYFTYWKHWGSGTVNEVFYDTMINTDGTINESVYNAVKAANEEVKKFDRVYMDFTWQGTMKCAGNDADGMLANMSSYNSPRISNFSSTQDAIVGCLKDSKGYDGFMIVNATDPADETETEVTVTFRDATKAIIYIKGEETEVTLEDGTYTATLASGEGIFVIPYIG